MATCRACGDKAKTTCKCGANICPSHAHYYNDGQNGRINESARPECPPCAGVRIRRPLTEAQAIEALEW